MSPDISVNIENAYQQAFDDMKEQWYFTAKANGEEEEDGIVQLASDDSVSFECLKINESGGIISIVGTHPVVPPERLR